MVFSRIHIVLLLAAAVVSAPATATATMWFPAQAGTCVQLNVPAQSDCEKADLSDPSSNMCFEGAEVPISTLPSLLAESRGAELGRQLTAHVVGSALALAGADAPVAASVDDTQTPRDAGPPQLEIREDIPRPRPTRLACSESPDECRSLPPLVRIHLEVTPQAARTDRGEPDVDLPPTHPEAATIAERLRVGPSSGHPRRLERPPELA